MQNPKNSLIFFASLVVRLWLSPKLDFGVDQHAIFEMGKKFYETGSIQGGFQAVMSGLPLFLSLGSSVGLQLWIGFLNWCAMLMLFWWLRQRVKPQFESMLAFFLAFSPWSLLFSSAWIPSFLPIFAVPFFWILEQTTSASKSPLTFWKPYLLGVMSILCLQLHLSAVLLAIAVLIALPSIRDLKKFFLASFLGILSGSVLFIPWFIEKMNGTSSALTDVVGIHLENMRDIPKAFFRYLAFPTAEISRFITPQGHGFQGMVRVLSGAPLLWLPALISLVGSGVLVWFLLKRIFILATHAKDAPLTGFERVELLLPILMTFTFLFSIKGVSVHTFWILMPLAFYSMVMALRKVSERKHFQIYVWTYLMASVVFAICGFLQVQV